MINEYFLLHSGYEFMVECDAKSNAQIHDALEILKDKCSYFQIISRAYNDQEKVVLCL